MADPTSPVTELEAVNSMLMSVGKAQVDSLTTTPPAAAKALTVLQRINRSVQAKSWYFNTDFSYSLAPDANQYIMVPDGCMSIRPTDRFQRLVERVDPSDSKRKIWDLANQTFLMGDAVDFRIVWCFAFEDIPQVARDYIAARAGREYQRGVIGSQILYKFDLETERECLILLKSEDRRQRKANMLYGNDPSNRIWTRHYFDTSGVRVVDDNGNLLPY